MKIEFRTHDDKTKLYSKWFLFPIVPAVGASVWVELLNIGGV